jgi:hypothetical protein
LKNIRASLESTLAEASNANSTWNNSPIELKLFLRHPTLFWIIEPSTQNLFLISQIGIVLSLFAAFFGAANIPIMASLWLLYMSVVNIGQAWYSFGWESQLLETGFLAIFLVPCLTISSFPKYCPTPWIVVAGYLWLLFRIVIGAGLIKIRGDQCWRDLTCMNYHYQTQPVPNPISPRFHFNPGFSND